METFPPATRHGRVTDCFGAEAAVVHYCAPPSAEAAFVAHTQGSRTGLRRGIMMSIMPQASRNYIAVLSLYQSVESPQFPFSLFYGLFIRCC